MTGTITSALRTAQSGLLTNQSALDAVANNIANVNSAGYSRKIVALETRVVNGTGRCFYTVEFLKRIGDIVDRFQQTLPGRQFKDFTGQLRHHFAQRQYQTLSGQLLYEFGNGYFENFIGQTAQHLLGPYCGFALDQLRDEFAGINLDLIVFEIFAAESKTSRIDLIEKVA